MPTDTLRSALLGGPGLDGYAYCADVYCADCGRDEIKRLHAAGEPLGDDSESTPIPIFFGESPDCRQHCASCGEHLYGEEPEREEPDEDSITTGDNQRFYQYGKLVLTVPADADHVAALQAFMEREQFWPDAYFISDHGNAHRIDLSESTRPEVR